MGSAEKEKPLLIAIVAGEPSGDRLGGGLIRELKLSLPATEFEGIGGPKMRAEGCDTLFDMDRIGVMGLDGLKDKLVDILQIRRQLRDRWLERKPDILVAIDVPDFNLPLEAKLKTAGIPCLHYVSPTVWAWRGYRIHKIKRSIHHILTLFPFEATFYEQHGVPVTCVGHPIADEIDQPDKQAARAALGLGNETVIALLPGSRRSEVKRLAPTMIAAIRLLLVDQPDLRVVLPFAGDSARRTFHEVSGDISDLPIQTLEGQSRLAMEAADVGILASGTASLEAALLQLPHVVIYRLSRLSYWIMMRLRHVDRYAMPNHLMSPPLVPELIQDQVSAEAVVEQVNGYLQNAERVQEIKQRFREIHLSLKLGADKQAARAVTRLIGQHHPDSLRDG